MMVKMAVDYVGASLGRSFPAYNRYLELGVRVPEDDVPQGGLGHYNVASFSGASSA